MATTCYNPNITISKAETQGSNKKQTIDIFGLWIFPGVYHQHQQQHYAASTAGAVGSCCSSADDFLPPTITQRCPSVQQYRWRLANLKNQRDIMQINAFLCNENHVDGREVLTMLSTCRPST
mmetsp:Transcript_29148/g.46813  ORF Transcript_29148/g.46813 Transcript_29148/m.46813 type:complete len:122 (+) Transcript_29148:312-677(+)